MNDMDNNEYTNEPSATEEAVEEQVSHEEIAEENDEEKICCGMLQLLCSVNTCCDRILEKARELPVEKYFSLGQKWAVTIGAAAFTISGIIAIFLTLAMTVKIKSFSILLIGLLIVVPACFLFAWIGNKLFTGISQLIENFPSPFASQTFLDCVALVNLFVGAATLIFGVVGAINAGSWVFFGICAAISVAAGFTGLLAVAPKVISVNIVEKSSPAEELIGIVSFKIKALLLATPFIWCAGAVILAIASFQGIFSANTLYFLRGFVLFVGLLPIIVYIGFLASVFCIDMARAILSVPGKLDELKKQ